MKCEYLGGGFNPGEFPECALPEAAFIGRSNVGKSSLINSLVNQRQMARVSSTPGRTQAIHFFAVNDAHCLVDLPGYGFAKAPKAEKAKWGPLIESYILGRSNLKLGVLLMDARRDPRDDEFLLTNLFRQRGVPLLLVVTKTDKLAKTRRGGRVQQLAKGLGVPQQCAVGFSALKGDGRENVWRHIRTVLDDAPR